MNRGVEIDPVVADAADALIETQVRAGLVTRMAVLYDLLTHGPVAVRPPPRSTRWPDARAQGRTRREPDRHGARVLDPVNGVDAQIDVRIDDGVIAQLGTSLERNGHRVIDGAGLVLAPAFVDPHVHLRVPGREDEETIASGTAAAAAGGFCAILADAEHRARRRLGSRCSGRSSRTRAGRPRFRSAFWRRSRRARPAAS